MEEFQIDIKNEKLNELSYEKPIGVYVKRNINGKITEINSDIFIDNLAGWEKIDEGYGDKYAHAQSQYFDTF